MAAHQNWQQLPEGTARVDAFYNEQADLQAKLAVTRDHSRLFAEITKYVEAKTQTRTNMTKYHDFLCEMHDLYFQQTAQPSVQPDVPDFHVLTAVSGPTVKYLPQQAVDSIHCPYGDVFFHEFFEWWKELDWGTGPFVSGLEMYFSFAISRRMMVPVRTGPKTFHLRDTHVEADVQSCELATQSHLWLQILKWWLGELGQPIALAKGRGLHPFGYTFEVRGFTKRPIMPNGLHAAQTTWAYFHDAHTSHSSHSKVRRDLRAPWHIRMLHRVAEGGVECLVRSVSLCQSFDRLSS